MINIAKPQITQAEKDAVLAVLDSGMIANGTVVAAFEQAFAAYIGSAFGIATTSGTTALEVATRALGLGAGDKVLTTAYSFIASTNSILYAGARPVFIDIDGKTFNMDLDLAEATLRREPDIAAIQAVHLFGQPCDMDGVTALAKRYDLKIIEDCAQAHGAKWKDQKVGTFGDASAFSFYPTKNMTTGEGGIVLTDNETVQADARLLINHGMRVRYTHETIGYNYRMTNIAAAIGLEQLKKLDGFNDARRKNARHYDENINNPLIETPYVSAGAYPVYHQYTVKVKEGRRDDLIRHLEAEQIGYGLFYPTSIPEQPCYREMGLVTEHPVVDAVKQQVLSIPVHPGLSEADVAAVVRAINSFK